MTAADLSIPIPKVKKATRRERWAWYLYDFGNSAYAAVVLLAIYSAYFKESVVGGAEGSRLWGLAVGAAMLVVAFVSPILGTIADFSGAKKRFLFFFTGLCVVFTALLFFVQEGDIFIGMLFFIFAEIGYRSSQVFYDALLPEIATRDDIGEVSGIGWAIGSAGGIVCLLIVLALILTVGGPFMIRLSFFITAAFFALSAIPIFLWLRERAEPQPLPAGQNYLSIAAKRLSVTFAELRHYREAVKFIIAFLIYNDGIIMALDFAAIIGAVLYGMEQQQLIILMIIVQVTSIFGAYLFGLMAGRISSKRSLLISLALMIAAVVWMLFNQTLTGFFVIAALAGFALTGVQSVSRTLVGEFAPPGKSAEFYGFFSVAGRTSSFIGPTVYGLIATGWALRLERSGMADRLAEQIGQRAGIASILVFLIIGTLLLLFVNEKKGKREAQRAAQPEAAAAGEPGSR